MCTGAAFREQVEAEGLETAYAAIDVVVAANAEFTDQASLLLGLGPSDPPIRVREFRLGAWRAWAAAAPPIWCCPSAAACRTRTTAAAPRCWPTCWRELSCR